jgi:hypothetical protein
VNFLVAGSAVTVECRGGGCPSRAQHWRPRGAPRRWNALGRLAGRRLRAGARVIVTIQSAGHLTKVVQLTMRRRRGPSRRVHCVGPISGLVTRHCQSFSRPGPANVD